MPDAMTDSFLAGQGIPVDLGQVETELTKLWGPAAEQAGGPELENPHVTRIALANLVVECPAGDVRAALRGARDGHRAVPLPGDRAPRVGRPRAADRGGGLGAVPPAGPGPAAGLLRADRAPRRAGCRSTCSPAPSGRCSSPSCR